MAQQQKSLLNWRNGKSPLGNTAALLAGITIVLIFSPVIVAYMLFVKFSIPATLVDNRVEH